MRRTPRFLRAGFISLLVFTTAGISSAQYEFAGFFDQNEGFLGYPDGCHGLAVDPAGNVWIQYYNATDTIIDAGGVTRATHAIRVYHPDGTPLSFSPIRTIEVDGVADTLFTLTGRGLGTDRDGNILASYNNRLYKIDYRTGAGLRRFETAATLTAAAGDSAGRVFVGRVVPYNGPLEILDGSMLASLGNVFDGTSAYSRGLAVSPDGRTVYWAGYTNHCVYVYKSPTGAPGTFSLTDTILKGFDAESFARHPGNGQIWASSGSGNDQPNRYPGLVTNYTSHTWYAYDPESGLIVDAIRWVGVWDSVNTRPRAIAFSPTGDTAYVGMFGTSMTFSSVQRFINRPTNPPTAGQYDPDSATVLLLHMNEPGGNLAADSSGGGTFAFLTKAAVVPGRFGLGRQFGAGGHGGRVPNSPRLNPSTALTLEAWFKLLNPAGSSTFIAKPGPDGQSGYTLQLSGNGSILAFGVNTKLSATIFASVTAESLSNGRWHHVAGTYDGNVARIYLDGALLASGTLGVTLGTSSTDSVIIGEGFDGVLDEVRISSTARQPGDFSFVQPPTALRAMVVGTGASIRWNPPPGRVEAAGYLVSYKQQYSTWSAPIAVARTCITLRCLLPGTFYVRVASVDAVGNASAPSPDLTVSSQYYSAERDLASEIMSADVYAAADSPWTARTRSFYPSPTGWTEGVGDGSVRHLPFTNWCSSDLDPIDLRLSGHPGEARATVLAYRIDTPKNIALSFGIPDSAGAASLPVRFVVQVEDTAGKITPLVDTALAGRNRWGALQADLSPWSSRRIILRLIASPGTPSTSGQVFWADVHVSTVLYARVLNESEPNDTMSLANAVTRGDTVQGGITPAGDRDYFSLNAAEGDTLEIDAYTGLEGQERWPAELTLMDSLGVVLARSQIPSVDDLFLTRARVRLAPGSAGKFFVRIRRGPDWEFPSADTGRYAIAVRRLIPEAPSLHVEQPAVVFHDSAHFSVKLIPNGRPTTLHVEEMTSYPPSPLALFGPFDSLDVLNMIVSIPVTGPAYSQSVQFTVTSDFGSSYPDQRFFSVPGVPQGWISLWQRTMENVRYLSFCDGRFGAMVGRYSLYCTSDSGLTWEKVGAPPGSTILGPVARPDSDLLVGVRLYDGIFRSTNGGASWTKVKPVDGNISTITFLDRTHGFIGAYNQVLCTSNGGVTWVSRDLGTYQTVMGIQFLDTLHGFVLTEGALLRTGDGGQTWNSVQGFPSSLYGFSGLIRGTGGTLLAIGNYMIVRSSDGGQTWEYGSLPGPAQSGAALDNGRIYIAGSEGKILFSNDGGVNWSTQSSGTSNNLYVAVKAGNRVVVGGEAGVLLRSVEGGAVAVEEAPGIPAAFALYQNYPNPFNPATRIRFDLPATSHVRLEVYNALGQLVEALLDEDRPAGQHEVAFSSTRLASGVYFYRIQSTPLAGGEKTFSETKKMILLH